MKSELSLNNSVDSVFLARVEASRIAYYTFGKKSSREPSIEYIHRLTFEILSMEWTEPLLQKALEIELRYEKTTLTPNIKLIDFLKLKKKEGKTIIGISDMYLSSNSISELVFENGESLIFDELYSSADVGESKREGALYDVVVKDMGVDKRNLLHCGDSYHSDFLMAKKHGITSFHTPRNRIWEIKTKYSHFRMLKQMGVA
ncbi:HAD hydrolase-like protein [Vibrio sp. 10N.261.55.A10]|uniref:HAD hydrolase-like protein n=1 Tax=Vibrio sp. 10N.261.55.A10 TaxID=3229687 RepID=UPI00354C15E6